MRYLLILFLTCAATLGHAQAMLAHPAPAAMIHAGEGAMPCCDAASSTHATPACAAFAIFDTAPMMQPACSALTLTFPGTLEHWAGRSPCPPTGPPRPV
ncbi:hypothetical protein ACEWPM_002645 [Roseovarius sp. S4756]|uniref:hypothetical protein n=1 Tax=Roseovarius maritimus TaxID=3342637 RepID=UPI0037278ECF